LECGAFPPLLFLSRENCQFVQGHVLDIPFQVVYLCDLLAVCRFGAGYDTVDKLANSAVDMIIFNAIGAVELISLPP
jgi:hypothetical protein